MSASGALNETDCMPCENASETKYRAIVRNMTNFDRISFNLHASEVKEVVAGAAFVGARHLKRPKRVISQRFVSWAPRGARVPAAELNELAKAIFYERHLIRSHSAATHKLSRMESVSFCSQPRALSPAGGAIFGLRAPAMSN